jgi:hypothetical protein
MNMQIIVAVVFFMIALAVTYLIKNIRDKNIEKLYFQFAESYKLKFTFESFLFKKRPELRGQFNGSNIHVYNTSDGNIEASKRYYFTLAEIDAPQFETEFSICKENFLKEIGELLGYQDIAINLGDLDKQFVFKAKDPEKLRLIIQKMNLQLFDKNKFGKEISYSSGKFTCKIRGIIKRQKDIDKLESMLNICIEMVKKHQ